MKISKFANGTMRGMSTATIVTISALLASCAHVPPGSGPKGGKPNPYVVTFNWQALNGCKVDGASVTPEMTPCVNNPQTDFCVGRDKWVEWRSTPAKSYDIYFAPSAPASFHAGNNGIAKMKIKDDAPYAEYKYTILGTGCSRDNDAFDPRVRVDH